MNCGLVSLSLLFSLSAFSSPGIAAIRYVDGSVSQSGDGASWQTAFETIQEGIDGASEGDTVLVGPRTYVENVRFRGANIVLRSTDPLDPMVVANTVIDGDQSGSVVTFPGAESARCVIAGFTIRNGKASFGGGISGSPAPWRGDEGSSCPTIRNNIITANEAHGGGGLCYCHGLIASNVISRNRADGVGGGLAYCGGVIVDNVIFANSAVNPQPGVGRGGGVSECYYAVILNNTIFGNATIDGGGGICNSPAMVRNCIIWRNVPDQIGFWWDVPSYSCIEDWTEGGEGNTTEEPLFADANNGDFRLRPDSPCIDAGFNDPELPEADIAGMHRIMYGGKSLTVDMGAYEFYINDLLAGPQQDETTFTWSSLAEKTYSIFYTEDLLMWHLVVESFPSAGNQTTSWIDDGMLTGVPPSLAPRRFYRVLENP